MLDWWRYWQNNTNTKYATDSHFKVESHWIYICHGHGNVQFHVSVKLPTVYKQGGTKIGQSDLNSSQILAALLLTSDKKNNTGKSNCILKNCLFTYIFYFL